MKLRTALLAAAMACAAPLAAQDAAVVAAAETAGTPLSLIHTPSPRDTR